MNLGLAWPVDDFQRKTITFLWGVALLMCNQLLSLFYHWISASLCLRALIEVGKQQPDSFRSVPIPELREDFMFCCIFVSMCVCAMYVCTCMYVRVCVLCMHLCVCVWRSEINMDVFTYCSPYLLRQGFSVNLVLINRLAWPTNLLWPFPSLSAHSPIKLLCLEFSF